MVVNSHILQLAECSTGQAPRVVKMLLRTCELTEAHRQPLTRHDLPVTRHDPQGCITPDINVQRETAPRHRHTHIYSTHMHAHTQTKENKTMYVLSLTHTQTHTQSQIVPHTHIQTIVDKQPETRLAQHWDTFHCQCKVHNKQSLLPLQPGCQSLSTSLANSFVLAIVRLVPLLVRPNSRRYSKTAEAGDPDRTMQGGVLVWLLLQFRLCFWASLPRQVPFRSGTLSLSVSVDSLKIHPHRLHCWPTAAP